jgi:hypothetical protein
MSRSGYALTDTEDFPPDRTYPDGEMRCRIPVSVQTPPVHTLSRGASGVPVRTGPPRPPQSSFGGTLGSWRHLSQHQASDKTAAAAATWLRYVTWHTEQVTGGDWPSRRAPAPLAARRLPLVDLRLRPS